MPAIRYTSTYDLASSSTHVDVGDRVVICYRPLQGPVYTSGRIRLYGFSKLANSEQKVQIGKAADYDNWASPPFSIEAFWRSGQFINLMCYIFGYQTITPEKFVLVADQSTIDDEMPKLHMLYVNRDDNDGDNPLAMNASFDINPVWSRPGCKGVVIYYPTTSGVASASFYKK